jgi:hypothetical protein
MTAASFALSVDLTRANTLLSVSLSPYGATDLAIAVVDDAETQEVSPSYQLGVGCPP